MRGNGAASVTPASSSRPLLTQHTGRNWLNVEIVESSEVVRCRPARSSADVCQRGAVRQRMGGGNTPGGVSPHPQGVRLALRLVRQGDGLHYPVGQPLFGDSLPFLLPSVADKELLRASDAPGAVHVYAQCSYALSRWRVTAYAPTFLAGKKALFQSCIFGGLLCEKNTRSRTDSISVRSLNDGLYHRRW